MKIFLVKSKMFNNSIAFFEDGLVEEIYDYEYLMKNENKITIFETNLKRACQLKEDYENENPKPQNIVLVLVFVNGKISLDFFGNVHLQNEPINHQAPWVPVHMFNKNLETK